MFSKSQFKLIKSLTQKKYRLKQKLFVVEGKKAIFELLNSSLQLHSIYTTEDIFNAERNKTFFIDEPDLKKISNLTTPQTALAIFHIPETQEPDLSGLVVALDGVQDPGNLGTIIRMCDWFGVEQLLCSEGTVDCYNPKVVQATMGSISRVNINYVSLPEALKAANKNISVYGAFLEGDIIYSQDLKDGIIVMGNEANGISSEIETLITKKLLIPQFGKIQETESLNVATATAIFLSEFRRTEFTGK
ncbi:TrmH family RNA methyltransferase [Salinimicrobium gaetbulicola]|uniref:TrmH family RNA methyltransferase n=1 Tax=Salinimicrobium gaetbulicola TaxID=999702 RepID=A0ABW3IFE2_9FLAO